MRMSSPTLLWLPASAGRSAGRSWPMFAGTIVVVLAILPLRAGQRAAAAEVPRWGLFEAAFNSTRPSDNPLQDTELRATFTAPSSRQHTVHGFWDGGATWRVRFSPDEPGQWTYTTTASPESESGLHGQKGVFRVV